MFWDYWPHSDWNKACRQFVLITHVNVTIEQTAPFHWLNTCSVLRKKTKQWFKTKVKGPCWCLVLFLHVLVHCKYRCRVSPFFPLTWELAIKDVERDMAFIFHVSQKVTEQNRNKSLQFYLQWNLHNYNLSLWKVARSLFSHLCWWANRRKTDLTGEKLSACFRQDGACLKQA